MINDLGVDFAAKHNEEFFEVQVKSIRRYTYTNIQEDKNSLADNVLGGICANCAVLQCKLCRSYCFFPGTFIEWHQTRGKEGEKP